MKHELSAEHKEKGGEGGGVGRTSWSFTKWRRQSCIDLLNLRLLY